MQRPKGVVHGSETGLSGGVVAPRRPALSARDADWLPRRRDEPVPLETAKRRVDGAAGQSSLVDDVESVMGAVRDCMQDAKGSD